MDNKKVLEIISGIKKNKEKLFLWTFKYDELIELEAWISELNTDNIKVGFLSKRYKVAESILGSRNLVYLYSPALRVAFASKLIHFAGNEIDMAHPSHFEVMNLREDIRMDIDCRLQINVKGKMYNFDTFDIGYNGISIIVKEHLKPIFKVGLLFDECYLYLADKKVRLKAQIRNHVKMNAYEYNDVPYTFYRVGMEFIDPSEKKKDFLRKVIDSKKRVG